MAKIVENTPQRLALQAGSTTVTLDKGAGTAVMTRKMMFWSLKPLEKPLADIVDATVDAAVDRASGVEVCHIMLIDRAGAGWAVPANDKADAQAGAAAVRQFIGKAA
jgi:hypothetical protein